MSLKQEGLSIYGPTNFLQTKKELGFHYHSIFLAKFFNFPGTTIWRYDINRPISFTLILPNGSVHLVVDSQKYRDNTNSPTELSS